MDLPGVGFLTCHNLYRDLGGNTTRKKCQALAAWYTMHASGAGHTWFAPALVANGINELVSTSIPDPLPALRLAKRARRIAVRRDEMGTPWLADYHHDQQEGAIAQRVARMLDDDGDWPEIDRLDASPHQRQQAANAMARGRIGILTGGPGTGKTRTTARLVAAMEDRWGSGQVACCAPTGKAAVRLSEVMDGYGVGVRARTIHSLLGVTAHAEGGGWSFEHGPGKPLPFRAIVLDEGSMPDVPIMASLLEAMPQGAHLLMVGDTGQLPPVGHGKPMDDLIRAGVGYGELTETFRNGGTIVEACRRIGLGQPFLVDKELDPPSGKNLYHLHASEERVDEVLWSSIQRLARAGVVEPVMGLQVITAVNEKTPCSRQRLNEFLQGTINPDGARAAGTSFRQHDKVVCLKNGFIKQDDQSETFVANGEQGRVVGVDAGTITVALTAPTRVIRVRGEALRRWDLAYAISCHKAQGSEWPVVIVVLDPSYGARMVTSREWLRTAISRAKTACLLVGSLDVARRMVQREVISRRKTFLPERIAACREDLVDVAAPARSPAMAL
jgi:exodeoxyribonuclease V alpha subunit